MAEADRDHSTPLMDQMTAVMAATPVRSLNELRAKVRYLARRVEIVGDGPTTALWQSIVADAQGAA